jgi:phosphodiesterase/alkaline phosphatase D-like protein
MHARRFILAGLFLLPSPAVALQQAPGASGANTSSRLAAVSSEALATLAAGQPQEILVVLDDHDAAEAAARIRTEEKLSYDGPRGLRAKADLYDAAKRALFAALGSAAPELLRDYRELPVVFVRVRSIAELEALATRPEVIAVEENRIYQHASSSLSPLSALTLIRQPQVATAGQVGTGTVVAVLDTPIDAGSPGFPQCTVAGQPTSCVVATMDFTGGNAYSDHSHGTNVAGIVLSTAPDSRIAAVTVTAAGDSVSADAVMAAIDWCMQQKKLMILDIVAINMSIGFNPFPAPCPNIDVAVTSAITASLAANILPVAAAGNSSLTGEISWPACIPGVVSVGAVYDSNIGPQSMLSCTDQTTAADQITCFSNVAPFLSLLAPGAMISVAGPPFWGTSQAAPFVSGAAAVLRAAFPQETLAQTVSRMTSTGVPLSRPGTSFSTPRLDLWAASLFVAPTVTLAAAPASGASPLSATLTATVSGSGTAPIDYDFWWSCNDPRTDATAVAAACGALPSPAAGSCASNTSGAHCAAVTANPQAVTNVYSGTATSTPKVIAVRNGIAAESRTTVVVTVGPAVTTSGATALAATGATLGGSVNGEMAATTVWFEWGSRADLVGAAQTLSQTLPASGASQAVSAPLAGLNPNITYWFRAAATNAGGTVRGAILSFSTPSAGLLPAVATQAASAVTAGGAVLSGLVDPFGLDTLVKFEWGTDAALANPNVTGTQDVGAGTSPLTVSANLSGLSPGTTYYFRIVGTSLAGTERGLVMSFVTLALSQQQLVGNGGFENGVSPWGTTGNFQIASGFPYPHAGTGYAFLGLPSGLPANSIVGTLDQTVTIPANVSSALLTFWYNIGSQDSTTAAYDFLDVTIEDAAGNYVETVKVLSNLDQGPPGVYLQASYDMTHLAGRTVRLHFLGSTDGSLPTIFRLDDVSLLVSANAPSVVTAAASAVTSQSATVAGTVNPQGTATTAWFEWATSPGLDTYAQSPPQGVGAGTSPLTVSQPLAGLSPATTWYYRAAAANASGTARGSIASFTTGAGPAPPAAGTAAATAITSAGAVLNGNVIPGASAATAWFEWGTDPALTVYAMTTRQALPAGASSVAVSAPASGLAASTTYYFRVAASNVSGTARAAILGFTTSAAAAPPQTLTVAAANAPGGVAVIVTPNDNGGLAGATTPFNRLYDSGTAVTLTAPASASGQGFLEWIDNGAVLTENLTVTVTLNTNSTLTAVYGSGSGVQVLALGLDNPSALAVDATSVYWVESGLLRKIGKQGGTPANLASGLASPAGLAVAGGFAFVGESLGGGQSRIDRFTVDGLSSLVLATDSSTVTRLAVDGANVYWTDFGGGGTLANGSVRSVPRSGGAVTVLATGSIEPMGIAADGRNVYWTEFNNPGRLQSVPAGGGASVILANGTNSAGVASDGTQVYWTQNTSVDGGQVNALPTSGGITAPLATGLAYPWDLAIDGVNVYWIGTFSGGNVQQVAAGGGSPVLLAAGLSWPVAVATDGAFVYWVERGDGGPASGTLKRVPVSPCSYTFQPGTATYGAAGGGGGVAVTTPAGCAWTAASDESWVTISAGASGNGSGTLSYSVAANTGGGPRLGTVHIQGQIFVVDQAGAASTATLWARTYGGGSGGDVARMVVHAADGGLAVAGLTGFGAGGGDAMVLRLDGSGNVLWVYTYGGAKADEANAIALTADGGFLVAGDTASFGAGGTDGWLFKLDSSGNLLWQRTYGGSGADTLKAVQATADGGSIVAGFTSSFGAGQGDVWVLRLDAAGNVVWQATYGGAGIEGDLAVPGCGLLQTADGGFAVMVSSFSFGSGQWEAWALKLDGSGNVQWQKAYGGSGHWFANDLAAAADGGFWVAGELMPAGGGNTYAWVAKLDAQGGIEWQENLGTGGIYYAARSVTAASDGGAVVAGGGPGTWLAKLDATGAVQWSKSYGNGVANSVAALAGGGFAAASQAQLGTTWTQFFVLKVDAHGAISPSCTSWVDDPLTPASGTAVATATAITTSATAVTPAAASAIAGLPAIAVAEKCAACSPPPTATVSLMSGQAATICGGSSATLQAALTGTAPWTVTWSDGVTQSGVAASPATRQVSPAATTVYTVTSLADAACTGTATGTAQINVTPAGPAPVLGNNGPLCAGATLQLTAPAVAGGSYTWTGPAGFTSLAQNPAIAGATAAASGTYTATVAVNGCQSLPGSSAVTVNPIPGSPAASSNTPVCAGTTLLLSAATVPGASYAWSGPGGFSAVGQKAQIGSAAAANAGTYTVTAAASGCNSRAAATTVAVLPMPSATVRGGGIFCPGRSVTASAALQGTPPWTLTWSDGLVQSGVTASPATRIVAPATATAYSVVQVDDAQCTGTASGSATADPSCKGYYFTVTPCRVIDTRQPAGPRGGPSLAAGQQRLVTVAGVCGIPSTARAVVVNVTAVVPTAAGFLNLYPAGSFMPGTSVLNYAAGQIRANNAVVELGAGGAVAVASGQPSGTTDFLIDVGGYFE